MSPDYCDKRSAILAAALDLFAEHGFHGAPASAIAEAAGVGVGTIYRYFKDKDELIRELFRELHGRVHREVFDVAPVAGRPVRESFLILAAELLRWFLACPREFRFMEQYYFSPYHASPGDEVPPDEDELFQQLLLSGREGGIIKDAPLPVLEAIAFGPLVALAKEHGHRRLPVDAAMIRAVVEACWDGLKR